MISPSFPTLAAALALAVVASPAAATAQAVVQPLPGSTDADRLADQMRRLAVSPQDVSALVTAGELSLKLDDLSAAAALFARAEKVDPRNARIKAGMASILVRSERPGEALRYFAQAEAMGLSPAHFAADRGFAYDLIGEQERAQRDYRVALRDAPGDDETIRRYALSLGISGRRDQALAQLDPLLRKTDRGAWRARAFVLAMTGDQPGAERIATTMMPPGMAAGLQPFFQRLPALAPADRAFAVHFGEVHSTAERVADARMVPALAMLQPEPGTVTQVAIVAATPVPKQDKRKRDRKPKPGRVELASAVPVQTQPFLPPTPTYRDTQTTLAQVQPLPAMSYARAPQNASSQSARAANLAAQSTPITTVAATPIQTAAVRSTPAAPVQVASAATPRPSFTTATTLAAQTPTRSNAVPAASIARPGFTTAPATTMTTLAATTTPLMAPVTATPVVQPATPAAAAPTPAVEPVAPAVATAAPIPTTTVPPRAVAATRVSEDSILARIIAGLSIPAAELDVAEPVRPAPVPATAANVVAVAEEKEARDTNAKVAADKVTAEPARTPRTRRGKQVIDEDAPEPASRMVRDRRTGKMVAAADTASEAPPRMVRDRRTGRMIPAVETTDDTSPRTGRDRRTGKPVLVEDDAAPTKKLDRKALAAKKAADDKTLADAKAAAEDKKAARASPGRIWVQVSGGANEGDLPKAWKAVQAKAPALAGKAGYSTPLRATNRVVTGPFKTDAEARAFVNTLSKQGVSAFTFSSDAGQKVTKLPAR